MDPFIDSSEDASIVGSLQPTTTNSEPQPGVYHGVPFDEYFGWFSTKSYGLIVAASSLIVHRTPKMPFWGK